MASNFKKGSFMTYFESTKILFYFIWLKAVIFLQVSLHN